MVRAIVLFSASLFSLSCLAASVSSCPQASAMNGPDFCSSFKVAAQCHCSASLPKGMCSNMKSLHDRMITMFGSLTRACEYQHDTSTQQCIDGWNCYRFGGMNSQNQLCNGTGRPCESF